MTLLSRHGAFVLFLFFYGALLAFQFNHGIASGDGHGVVRSVQTLLSGGHIEVSRPPGHPATEIYVFGGLGWILQKGFGIEFGDGVYLVCQAIAAISTLIVFYELLLKAGVNCLRSLLATICLAFSAQYFLNAVDGEEFLFGLLFLLISIRFLIVGRWWLSILCFALATGCRAELIFAGIVFPIYCALNAKLGWKYAVASIPIAALAVFIVWLPIVFVGIHQPYTAGMNLRESIFGGVYRIVFQACTPAVFLLLGWTLIASLRDFRNQLEKKNFLFVTSCLLPILFLALFFLHASKAAHLLVALPFLLFLAVGRSAALLVALTFFTLMGTSVQIDIFKDRQLTRPFLTEGNYFQAVHQKPYYKLDYLRKLSDQCGDRPAIIIGNAWPWDFEYHAERANLPLRERDLHGEIKRDLPAFFSSGDHCIFLSPEAAFEKGLLSEWQRKGYAMKMDTKLYRTLFARYDVRTTLSSGTADVSGVSFNLFNVN